MDNQRFCGKRILPRLRSLALAARRASPPCRGAEAPHVWGLTPQLPFDLSAQQEGAANRSIPERLTAPSALRAGHGDDGVPWGYSVDAGGSPLPNTRSNHERLESLSIVLCCEVTCSWRDAICEFFASSSRARAAFCS